MVDMINGRGEIEEILYSDVIDLSEPREYNRTTTNAPYRRESAVYTEQQPQDNIEVQGEQYTQMAGYQNSRTNDTGNQDGAGSRESENISVSGLDSRMVMGDLPEPKITGCRVDSENTVTVEVLVNREGSVVAASIRDATYQDRCIWNRVKQAAFETKFSADQNASNSEKGWITYTILP